jgi:hypothetical protein
VIDYSITTAPGASARSRRPVSMSPTVPTPSIAWAEAPRLRVLASRNRSCQVTRRTTADRRADPGVRSTPACVDASRDPTAQAGIEPRRGLWIDRKREDASAWRSDRNPAGGCDRRRDGTRLSTSPRQCGDGTRVGEAPALDRCRSRPQRDLPAVDGGFVARSPLRLRRVATSGACDQVNRSPIGMRWPKAPLH